MKPKSAKDWELYRRHPLADEAAQALTKAIDQAVASLDIRDLSKLDRNDRESLLDELMRVFVRPVQSKYADAGAADSEPRYTAENFLRNAIKAKQVLQ